MATKLFLDNEDYLRFEKAIEEVMNNALAQIKSRVLKPSQGFNLKVSPMVSRDDRKSCIVFSPEAYIKTKALVEFYTTEVQWHGIVERIKDSSNFYVRDILVFPQTVTSATVDADQEEYEKWLDGLSCGEFNALRLHGHSHNSMGVTPSSTDREYRKKLISSMGTPSSDDDLFYIFMIFNNKGEWSAEIYDIKNNALFASADNEIILEVSMNNDTLTNFLKEAHNLVRRPKRTENEVPTIKDWNEWEDFYYGSD